MKTNKKLKYLKVLDTDKIVGVVTGLYDLCIRYDVRPNSVPLNFYKNIAESKELLEKPVSLGIWLDELLVDFDTPILRGMRGMDKFSSYLGFDNHVEFLDYLENNKWCRVSPSALYHMGLYIYPDPDISENRVRLGEALRLLNNFTYIYKEVCEKKKELKSAKRY